MNLFVCAMALLIHPRLSFTEEMKISIAGKNDLVLTGNNCAELLKQQTAICNWKKNIDPKFAPKPPTTCQSVLPNKFKIVVSECLPDLAKQYQQKKFIHEGPNCWGTAMSFKQLSPTPRFMWPEEMKYWMDSPVCRKLKPNEGLLPGDIINVYGPEKLDASERNAKDAGTNFWEILYPGRSTPATDQGIGYTGFHRLIHSVTFISKTLAFGKDSPAKDDPFYFHPMEEVYGRPRSSEKECQENQELEPYLREFQNAPKKIRGSKCSYFSLAYRCENFNEFIAKQNLQEDNLEIWKNVQLLQELQEKLFPMLVSSTQKLTQSEVTFIIGQADLSAKKAQDELKKGGLNTTHERLLVLQYFAASGIRQTLEQATLIQPLH